MKAAAQVSQNRLYAQRMWAKDQELHRSRLVQVKSSVDSSAPTSLGLAHLRKNYKKAMVEAERLMQVQKDNTLLVTRIAHMEPSLQNTLEVDSNRAFTHNVTQVQIRRRHLLRIEEENHALLKRIEASEPVYRRAEMLEEWDKREKFLATRSEMHLRATMPLQHKRHRRRKNSDEPGLTPALPPIGAKPSESSSPNSKPETSGESVSDDTLPAIGGVVAAAAGGEGTDAPVVSSSPTQSPKRPFVPPLDLSSTGSFRAMAMPPAAPEPVVPSLSATAVPSASSAANAQGVSRKQQAAAQKASQKKRRQNRSKKPHAAASVSTPPPAAGADTTSGSAAQAPPNGQHPTSTSATSATSTAAVPSQSQRTRSTELAKQPKKKRGQPLEHTPIVTKTKPRSKLSATVPSPAKPAAAAVASSSPGGDEEYEDDPDFESSVKLDSSLLASPPIVQLESMLAAAASEASLTGVKTAPAAAAPAPALPPAAEVATAAVSHVTPVTPVSEVAPVSEGAPSAASAPVPAQGPAPSPEVAPNVAPAPVPTPAPAPAPEVAPSAAPAPVPTAAPEPQQLTASEHLDHSPPDSGRDLMFPLNIMSQRLLAVDTDKDG